VKIGNFSSSGAGTHIALMDSLIPLVSKLLDRTVTDARALNAAKLELLKAGDQPEMQAILAQMQAVVAEAQTADLWTRRARPGFLYVMYALILWSIPMGLVAAVEPGMAAGIARGMTAYLRGIPEELYALFGTGYLGYTAARAWGKAKGSER
jgi:hypothetical protein